LSNDQQEEFLFAIVFLFSKYADYTMESPFVLLIIFQISCCLLKGYSQQIHRRDFIVESFAAEVSMEQTFDNLSVGN
jgi:hypothetical protein